MTGIEWGHQSRKWLIVHGHFYQPPRENPWLGIIETQESAAPFHDWNERIYSQCYRPNGYSRLLDNHGMISGVSNNYEYLSFNFGPTLVSWLEEYHPGTLERIRQGDRIGSIRCGGHGNALAQVYNHIIMPLASRRDKVTQIRWAKAAFKQHFGREPRGMWLAETAINMETVECLIEERLAFVVLSPTQAEAVRPLRGKGDWVDTGTQPVDTRQPYRVYPTDASGKRKKGHLDVFFFDESLSKDISFNGLLQDAGAFGERINHCYSENPAHDEVVVIATDGETFGHHKPFADMCLAWFFRNTAPSLDIKVVNFDMYRIAHPPRYEVSLKNASGEGTAWSCAHGVGRWVRDCGCNTGGQDGWNQKWRTPLRVALENLQKKIDKEYVEMCWAVSVSPWKLRDWYSDRWRSAGFTKWKAGLRRMSPEVKASDDDLAGIRRLLEAQRYILYSFTSCGWFFSELSGIEPMQNLAYACRALQLGLREQDQERVLDAFLADLDKAESNINSDTGATLFKRHILPYFSHNHMMAYIVVVEKVLGMVPGTVIREYGYTCRVEKVDRKKETAHSSAKLYRVGIVHERYGCNDSFFVVVTDAENGKPVGRVVRTGPDFSVVPTVQKVIDNDQAVRFTLPGVFFSLREKIAGQYFRHISDTSMGVFATWFDANRKELEALTDLYTSLPTQFAGAVGFVLQKKWDEAFSSLSLENVSGLKNEIASLHTRSLNFQVKLEYAFSAKQCENILVAALTELKDGLDPKRCDAMGMLLDITDRYGLPVAKHRLEDILYPVLSGEVREMYRSAPGPAVRRGKTAGRGKWLLIEKLLKFAVRMNFNVEAIVRS